MDSLILRIAQAPRHLAIFDPPLSMDSFTDAWTRTEPLRLPAPAIPFASLHDTSGTLTYGLASYDSGGETLTARVGALGGAFLYVPSSDSRWATEYIQNHLRLIAEPELHRAVQRFFAQP